MTFPSEDRKSGAQRVYAPEAAIAGRRSLQNALLIFIALSVASLCACGRPDETIEGKTTLVPVVRFVGETPKSIVGSIRSLAYEALRRVGAVRPLRTIDLATAIIDDDTRYVLRVPPRMVDTIPLTDMRVEADRHSIDYPLPDSFVGSAHAVVRTAARAGVHWSTPEFLGVLAVAQGQDGGLTVPISLPTAEIAPGATHLFVEIFGADEGLFAYDTHATVVPASARVKFATGLLPGTARDAKVAFTISGCEGARCREIFRDEREVVGEAGAPWRDHSVTLDEFAGQETTLQFRADVIAGSPDALTFPVWANPTIYAPAVRRRPSVILISLDTLRADRLPTYGYGHDTAPFLDETFGKAGAVFEDCTSSSASTPPAHMTMMTSLEPSRHEVRRGTETLGGGIATITEALRADGVTTGAVTEDGWLIHGQGFGRGFESYRENRSMDVDTPRGEIDRTLDAASEWIAAYGDSPFFLFVHTYQVHAPYTPPAGYQRLFVAEGDEASDSDRYNQEIRFTDDKLREFFAGLRQSGALDDLVVIVTSDHGEAFREHGYTQHSSSLHQEVVHVPCLFWGAGIPKGVRVKAPVGLIDLAPTIAHAMLTPAPRKFRGRDLSPLLSADAAKLDAELRDRVLVSEAWGDFLAGADGSLSRVIAPGLSFRRGALKVMRSENQDGVRYEVFDLAADPAERNDLSRTSENAIIAGLRDQLDEYLAMARGSGTSAPGAASERATKKGTNAAELAPDTENKLRALGYLQ